MLLRVWNRLSLFLFYTFAIARLNSTEFQFNSTCSCYLKFCLNFASNSTLPSLCRCILYCALRALLAVLSHILVYSWNVLLVATAATTTTAVPHTHTHTNCLYILDFLSRASANLRSMPHCNISIFGVDVAAREFIFHEIVINFVCCKVYSISILRAVFFFFIVFFFSLSALSPPLSLSLWSSVRVFSVHVVHILDLFLASKHGVNMLLVKNTPSLLLLLLLLLCFFFRFVLLSVILCVQSTRTPGSLFFISSALLLLFRFFFCVISMLFLGKYYLSIYSFFFHLSFRPLCPLSRWMWPRLWTFLTHHNRRISRKKQHSWELPTSPCCFRCKVREDVEKGSAFPLGQPTVLLIRNGTRTRNISALNGLLSWFTILQIKGNETKFHDIGDILLK